MVNWLFWKKQKVLSEPKRKKRRLQQVTVGQRVGSHSQQIAYTTADIYRQLNELTLLLTKHDLFLREEHHQKGLIPLSRFLAEQFYKLNAEQQQKIKQNLEFIETDKHILKALADSRRLRVVDLVGHLKQQRIQNRQYISERVNRLVEAGILERIRVGKNVFYSKINREPTATDMSGDT